MKRSDAFHFDVCEKACSECPFTGGALKAGIIRPGRLAQLRKSLLKKDSHFICHKFLIGPGRKRDVVCRGFFDAMPGVGLAVRLADRLGFIRFVSHPKEKKK